ncbi:tetratricopeptide repeat protein [Flavobacteriaceae bacterium F89]|uniref:histidine kinase n=1 Tax=Cerina litoralis TaxID=2874477 RepID=A0AAE3EWQ8_9FLAO|nr:tetratricopeptide repeat protein [Cerina litoralis]MCG2461076.1 tetratricopeptide repeat protein [Cerina litoralis]
MTDPTKPTTRKSVSFLLVFLFFLGCNPAVKDKDSTPNQAVLDSISQWVATGKNSYLTKKAREKNLEKAYRSAVNLQSDSLKARYLSEISLGYLRLKDSAFFRTTNNMALEWSEKTRDSNSIANNHWDLASFFKQHTEEDSAYYHYSKAQKIYSALKDDYHSGRMLYSMAIVQSDIKDYTGSEISTIKAIELLKPLEKYKQLYNCYNNLGTLSNALKEYDRALAYHNQALSYLKKVKKKGHLEQVTENNIGIVYEGLGQHQNAIAQFKMVLASEDLRKNDPRFYAKVLDNLAYNRFKLKDTLQVETQLNTALQIRDSLADQSGKAVSHYNLAEYFLFKKDTLSALKHAQEAKGFALESSNNKRLLKTLELLPRVDPKNAVTYTQEYMALNDSLLHEERQNRNKFERIRFETDEVIEKNQLLARQKQLFLGIALGIFLLGVAVLVIISQRIKNQRLKFKQRQQETDREIFNLMLAQSGKIEEGKQLEQKRVSQELHDGILGQMLGIRLVLSGLNNRTDEKAMVQRGELIKKLQDVEEEVRTISHELNDASYEKIHNFIHSIQDLISTYEVSTGIKCQFDYDSAMDWDQLNGELKINIYRIVQESLQNGAKHARCKNLSIHFKRSDGNLQIVVEDDGQGFDVRKGKAGIGLKNIDSRTKKMGGSWTIKSKIGIGTKLAVQLPIKKESMKVDHNSKSQVMG